MELALVFMAGGMSSRFGGQIKGFARVGPNGQSLIEYSIDQALGDKPSFTQIVFIVSHGTLNAFKDYFKASYRNLTITYILQTYDSKIRSKPWGTGDAICTLKGYVNCPFVLCNADDLYGRKAFDLLVNHVKSNANQECCDSATVGYNVVATLPDNPGGVNRGLLQTDESHQYVDSIIETFKISARNLTELGINSQTLCCTNLFALYPNVIDMCLDGLQEFKMKSPKDSEYLLPSLISGFIHDKKIKMRLYSTTDNWYGVTYPEDEMKLKQTLTKLHLL